MTHQRLVAGLQSLLLFSNLVPIALPSFSPPPLAGQLASQRVAPAGFFLNSQRVVLR